MARKMYRVTWEIDIEAASPAEAAREAQVMLHDSDAPGWSFEVTAPTGEVTNVDFALDPDGEITQSWKGRKHATEQ